MNKMVQIKMIYNPFKLETIVEINGKKIPRDSEFNVDNKKLQEWIDDLPKKLIKECNSKEADIIFHGMQADYQDLLEVAERAHQQNVYLNCTCVSTEEIPERRSKLISVFQKIQQGPFDELKSEEVIRNFKDSMSKEFEVDLVATVSAGKSTLINAILHQKLLPASKRACTSTIVEIYDNDQETCQGSSFDKDDNLLENYPELNAERIKKLNQDDSISILRIETDVPCAKVNDTSLKLVDTPGPNNAYNKTHRVMTYRMLDDSNSSLVLFIFDASNLDTNDTRNELQAVAENMKKRGKLSRDRYLFVINKLDEYDLEEDSISDTINDIKKRLNDYRIDNPQIFLIAARSALKIHTQNTDTVLDDNDIKNLIEHSDLHLETYAPLPNSSKSKLIAHVDHQMTNCDQVLLHTGVPSLEEAIRLYVEKYAEVDKIRDSVENILPFFESYESESKLREQLAENDNKSKAILAQISVILEELHRGKRRSELESEINNISVNDEIEKTIKDTIKEFAVGKYSIISRSATGNNTEILLEQARKLLGDMKNATSHLIAKLEVDLEVKCNVIVRKTANTILEKYKTYLTDLGNTLNDNFEPGVSVRVKPFELMWDSIHRLAQNNSSIEGSTIQRKIKTGQRYKKNENKKWYKFWTWFDEDGWYEDIFKNESHVIINTMTQKYFAPIEQAFNIQLSFAKTQIVEKISNIKQEYIKNLLDLDNQLRQKLEKLKNDSNSIEQEREQIHEKLRWIEDIKMQINKITEV